MQRCRPLSEAVLNHWLAPHRFPVAEILLGEVSVEVVMLRGRRHDVARKVDPQLVPAGKVDCYYDTVDD